MIGRALQFFFCAAMFFSFALVGRADLSLGKIYALEFTDIDGKKISTSDGHITVIVLTTTADLTQAHAVGDRVPVYCLGNPTYRMVSVINFQKKRSAPMRIILTAVARRRVDAEAKILQARYAANKIDKDARRDIFVVTDFDGNAVTQLGSFLDSSRFAVFVFARNGELLRKWDDLPPATELAAVVK
ncbi:MAG: hypothetical protein QOI04_701 [Verrucomicrobiota bacterium]|jgi:hypothetical protein